MIHTPGPWRAVLTYVHSVREDRRTITSVADCGLTPRRAEEAQANARLIAAAPELLEACKAALVELEGLDATFEGLDESTYESLFILRAAIAKAERAEQ